MTKTAQERLNGIFERMAKDYKKLSAKEQQFAIKEFARVRGDLSDLLSDFATKDGTIKRQRINRLLRELDEIETALRRYGMDAMDHAIDSSAAFATERINKAFERVVGRPAISGSIARLNRDVALYVTKRFGYDGLVLSDRVWRLAGDQRDDIAKVLRSDILQGESTSKMIADVRRVQDNETWKIKRLVITEGNTAYRVATSYNAQRSKLVKALELHPGAKRSRACTDLSNEDRYGLGRGIFLPDDPDIYNPHPQCTSYLTYVLDSSDYED